MKIRVFLFGCVGLAPVALVAAVSAQNARTSAPKPRVIAPPMAPSPAKKDNVILSYSPQGTADYDDKTHVYRLDKDVVVVQTGQDVALHAQHLVYNQDKEQAVATGNLRIETRSSTVRGERIFADFNTKIATIIGKVVVTTHGKRDGITGNRQDLRTQFNSKPSRITCDRADWDYEARQATLTGNIRMTQGENSGTCERILYDEEKNVAQLIGRVRFTDKQGRTFNTPNLTIYIDDGRLITKGGGGVIIPRNSTPGAPLTTPKTPILKVAPPPSISNEDLNLFNITPPPIPTPRPEATEAPAATPRPEPEEETPDAPEAPAAPARKR